MMKSHTFWMMVCATALLHVAVASATHPAIPTWGRNATIRFGVGIDMYQFNHSSSQAMVRFPILLENVPSLKDYHMALPGYGLLSVMWDCAKNETRVMFEGPGSPAGASPLACYRAPLHPESQEAKALCPLDEDAFKYFARLVYWHDGDDDDIAPMPMFNGTVASDEDRSLMNFWTFPTMHGDAYSPTLQYWENATTTDPVAVSFSSAQQEALALYVTEFSNVTSMNASMPCYPKNPGFPRSYGAGHHHSNATDLVRSVAELIGSLFQRISGMKQTQ